MSKTCVIFHSQDLDGWMSAAIVKHWFSKLYPRYDGVDDLNENSHSITPTDEETTGERLAFLGYNYGQPIPDLSGYNKVIMCDISFPKEEMEKLFDKLESNFIWIDHHKSAMNMMFIEGERSIHPLGLQQTDYAACELTWKYFFPNEPMPEIVRLLGRYDCFGHKNTDEEQKVLEFQYGARQEITNYESAYMWLIAKEVNIHYPGNQPQSPVEYILKKGKIIYQYLCTEAKQAYKNGFEIEFREDTIITSEQGVGTQPIIFNPPKVGKIVHKFICINKERFNPINFGIDYHKDSYDGAACFWYDGKQWAFSLYNDNGEVDCSVIAKSFGGGGHKGAAGFTVNNIEEFLKMCRI